VSNFGARIIGSVLPFESSTPEGFHLQGLTEPDVNLSAHPALIVQPLVAFPSASERID